MRKSIVGVLGLALGGLIGNAFGGPVVVVVAAGLGGLLGFYLGGLFEPAPARHRS